MEQNIINKLAEIESLIKAKNVNQMLTFNEASIFLRFSKSHLYKLTHKHKIAFYKPNGKLIYFNKSELESWLQKNRIKPIQEIEQESVDYVTLRGK